MTQTQVWITNNTNYNLTIDGEGPGNTIIGPQSSTRVLSDESNNSKNLLFWLQPNLYYMEGSLKFGTSTGVYVDRGDLPINDQLITLQTNIGDTQWTQSTNGGNTLLKPSEFSSGVDITLIFY
jgi:hypothetical protein